jgi:dolichyl-phosphate-mannose--protein O-mannosyl transferase
MKAYIITTGIVFALIAIAHVVHIAMERSVLREPTFLVLTVLAVALSVWAFVVLRRVSSG